MATGWTTILHRQFIVNLQLRNIHLSHSLVDLADRRIAISKRL
jgi:hypothetical protein